MDGEFEQFVRSRGDRLVRLAYLLSGDRQVAEDVVQEVLVKAHRYWGRVQAADDPDAYVRRMVVNEHAGWRRRWYTRWVRSGPVPEKQVPGGQGDVDERAEAWQRLAELPPKQRAVLVLRYYEDLPDADIALALSCAEGTVRSQASRALAALRASAAAPSEPSEQWR